MSEPSSTLRPLFGMLDELDGPALGELERALRGKLAPAQETPGERRVRRLGFLAQLIRETGVPRPPRNTYDELRPPEAPSGQELADEYGLWRKACRAAAGVLPDGRINRPGGDNHHRTPGARTRTPTYTRNEITNAIRRCALAMGRKPTSLAYERWRDREIAHAKKHGLERPRLPTLVSIARRFPQWPFAVAAAAIDDRELERARAKKMPRTERRPPNLTPTELTRAGTPHLVDRTGDIDTAAVERLPLSKALELCRTLDCSLEYLVGGGDRGRAPAGTRFVHETWKQRLSAAGVGERDLLKRIGMPLGPYRLLLQGRHEPTLGQLRIFAAITAASLTALLTEGDTP